MLIEHIAQGSYAYCDNHEVGRNISKYGIDAWQEYSVQIKQVISNLVIECAIKIRIIEDTLKELGSNTDFRSKDIEARENATIGEVITGNVDLTLRESCNKIVHASSVSLLWSEKQNGSNMPIEYWNSYIELYGTHFNRDWRIKLNLEEWAQALSWYLFLIDEVENVELFEHFDT